MENVKNYKIFFEGGTWSVYSGYVQYSNWVKDNIVFWSTSITECYYWIKAKEENLL